MKELPQDNPGQPKQDTYSYRGWLVSDSLIKRSFAVLGHYMLAYLMIAAVIGVIVIGITGLSAFMGK